MAKGQLESYKARVGEGNVLEVTRKIHSKPDGSVGFLITLDLNNAPVPDRRYVADAADAKYQNDYVYLMFWQRKISGDEARSMVIIVLSAASVLQFLRNADGPVGKLLKSDRNMPLTILGQEPAQTVCLAASIVAGAWTGSEACMDFYHASPFVISNLPNGKLAAEPVVRVTVPTGLMAALWRKVESFKVLFPKDETEEQNGSPVPSGGVDD